MAELTQEQEGKIRAFRERMDSEAGGGDNLTDDQVLWLISHVERPVRLDPGTKMLIEFPGDSPGTRYSGAVVVDGINSTIRAYTDVLFGRLHPGSEWVVDVRLIARREARDPSPFILSPRQDAPPADDDVPKSFAADPDRFGPWEDL